MNEKWLQTMAKSALFKGIAGEALPGVINDLNPKIANFKKNAYVAIMGEKFDGLGFILEGEVLVTKENLAGDRIIMADLKAGDMFGEIVAFTDYGLWPATVIAQMDSSIMFIQPQKIIDLHDEVFQSHKILITNFTRSISSKAFALNRKVDYLAVKSMKGKIGKYLLEQYKRTGSLTFMMPLNRAELADFLNVSRPTLSREFGKLRNDGVIDFYKSSVRILDLDELKNMLRP